MRAFLFGDHLSFTANFQPNLIVVVLAGKLAAGICAIVFAKLLAVKKAEQLEAVKRARTCSTTRSVRLRA